MLMKRENLVKLEGYSEIEKEIEVARRYGSDYRLDKGRVAEYINRLHPKRLSLRVNEVIEETDSTKTLRLILENGYLPPFQAGQYISVFVEVDGIRTSRPYSLSSPPTEIGHFDITVRRVEDGLISNYLMDQIKTGETIECSGPKGRFHFNPLIHHDHLVLLAGGSGITPFASMIRETASRGSTRQFTLLYGNRSLDDIIFHDEFQDLADRLENFSYIPVIESPSGSYQGKTGLMDAALISEGIGNLDGKSYFLCGPPGMYEFCLAELEKLKIPARKIKREMFGAPLNIWDYPGWPSGIDQNAEFTLSVNGREVPVVAKESILTALEREGLVVPTACRSGVCSMCRIKLLSGKIYQPPSTPVRKSDRQFGYIHSCVSYPLEDVAVLL